MEDQVEQQSLNKERSRWANFKFSFANVPLGAVLAFVRNEDIKVKVVDDRNVDFEGEATPLSHASLVLLNRGFGKNEATFQDPRFWFYQNETLSKRRTRLEQED